MRTKNTSGLPDFYSAHLISRDSSDKPWLVVTVKLLNATASTELANAEVFVDQALCGRLPAVVPQDSWFSVSCNGGSGLVGRTIRV